MNDIRVHCVGTMRIMKPVLLVYLLTLSVCAAVEEGSGDFLLDMEGFDDEEEGSGDLKTTPDKTTLSHKDYDVHFSKTTDYDDDLEYYGDVYPEDYQDFLENYDEDDQVLESELEDSVLKIVEEVEETVSDVEVKPKPDQEQSEQIIIETSQIFIMVGSAFVSFAIFMLSFFMCKRMIARKQEKKRIPFTVAPEKKVVKESSIVKDYQKVPTTTKEFLQNNSKYVGEEPAAAAPLVQ